MIYPVTLDLTILKNSTYQKFFTALKSGFTVQFDSALGTVISECHGLVAGDKIAFASPAAGSRAASRQMLFITSYPLD